MSIGIVEWYDLADGPIALKQVVRIMLVHDYDDFPMLLHSVCYLGNEDQKSSK